MQSILQPLIDVLFWILESLHDNLSLSWGWSIVILTVIVRVVLIPLTWKQFKSMRALQQLQPQMKALQEKYKGDRQLLNQKMMEFYKENKVNPMGSCLPLLLQMPVFFALFYMLRNQPFATDNHWLWIRDWGQSPDGLLAIDIKHFDLPLLILYVASQFVSSLQTVSKDSAQRTMMLTMPVAIGVIMYIGKWPAGLFIYWFTSNLWTIVQQFVITKTVPVSQPAAPVSTGGSSGPSGQRKRPKGKGGKR
ncbi:MAG: YidC/Oxa1 family membrane protein insertase [Thermoleophilia bacterium]|nr:YidC/Oxa1 family membrane protein insertase [Thermoleophilia bacterium]